VNNKRLGTRVCKLEYQLRGIMNRNNTISQRVALFNKKASDLKSSRKHYLKTLQHKHMNEMAMINRVRVYNFPPLFWKRVIKGSELLDKLKLHGPIGKGKRFLLYLTRNQIGSLKSFIERDKRLGRPNIKKDYQIVYLTPWQKRKLVRMLNRG